MNVVVSLGINHDGNVSNDDSSSYYFVELIYWYNDHLSKLSIKEKASGFSWTFSFNEVDPDKILIEIKKLMIYL